MTSRMNLPVLGPAPCSPAPKNYFTKLFFFFFFFTRRRRKNLSENRTLERSARNRTRCPLRHGCRFEISAFIRHLSTRWKYITIY